MSAVLLVWTPGLGHEAFEPLRAALVADGHEVGVAALPCSGDADTLARSLERRIGALDTSPVVVAHGVGATLAVLAAQRVAVRGLVLLAPVLDAPDHAAARFLAEQPIGARVDLSRPLPWRHHPDLRPVLLGEELTALGCLPAGLARDLASWVGPAAPPIDPALVRAPVWVGVGLLDEVAPLEVAVPAARRLGATVERVGVSGFDGRDFDHLGMLREDPPITAAVRAVREVSR